MSALVLLSNVLAFCIIIATIIPIAFLIFAGLFWACILLCVFLGWSCITLVCRYTWRSFAYCMDPRIPQIHLQSYSSTIPRRSAKDQTEEDRRTRVPIPRLLPGESSDTIVSSSASIHHCPIYQCAEDARVFRITTPEDPDSPPPLSPDQMRTYGPEELGLNPSLGIRRDFETTGGYRWDKGPEDTRRWEALHKNLEIYTGNPPFFQRRMPRRFTPPDDFIDVRRMRAAEAEAKQGAVALSIPSTRK